VVAQVLLAMRRIENWALWIAIDVLSIGVYLDRALYLTAGLYVVFLLLASAGLIAWAKAARAEQAITA
jgi:nicotinamide mononucleotide transporter